MPAPLRGAATRLFVIRVMPPTEKTTMASDAAAVLAPASTKKKSIPIWLARHARWVREAPISDMQKAWVEAQGFKGTGRKHLLLPGTEGELAGVVLGLGRGARQRSHGPGGAGARTARARCCRRASIIWPSRSKTPSWRRSPGGSAPTASAATRREPATARRIAQLKVPAGADHERALATVDGVWLGRDLINTPASDLGPQQLEETTRLLAKRHGAKRHQHRRRRSADRRTFR